MALLLSLMIDLCLHGMCDSERATTRGWQGTRQSRAGSSLSNFYLG